MITRKVTLQIRSNGNVKTFRVTSIAIGRNKTCLASAILIKGVLRQGSKETICIKVLCNIQTAHAQPQSKHTAVWSGPSLFIGLLCKHWFCKQDNELDCTDQTDRTVQIHKLLWFSAAPTCDKSYFMICYKQLHGCSSARHVSYSPN